MHALGICENCDAEMYHRQLKISSTGRRLCGKCYYENYNSDHVQKKFNLRGYYIIEQTHFEDITFDVLGKNGIVIKGVKGITLNNILTMLNMHGGVFHRNIKPFLDKGFVVKYSIYNPQTEDKRGRKQTLYALKPNINFDEVSEFINELNPKRQDGELTCRGCGDMVKQLYRKGRRRTKLYKETTALDLCSRCYQKLNREDKIADRRSRRINRLTQPL